ncbi:MAG: hypothetical protein WC679_00715 [Bacteroidales bacterium]|jgi:hypothetical protein
MNKKEFKPYTYLIGWSTLNKFYYGVQYGTKANPDNLWNSYFTSSKYVKEYREFYGEPDIIQVRKTFDSSEKARRFEVKVIKQLLKNDKTKWLNIAVNGLSAALFLTQKHKNKISIAHKGKKRSKQHIDNMKNFYANMTEDEKLVYSEKCKIVALRPDVKEKRNKAKKVCIHCNILIDPGNYEKFHGDNCKLKPGNEDIKFSAPTKGMKFPNRKKVCEQGIINMRNGQLGKKQTEEHKNNIRNSMLGKNKIPRTEEQKINSSIKMKDKMKIKELCPYCNNYFNKSHIIQWHGIKCKQYKDKT